MNPIASRSGLRDIVVEETLAHAPEIVWKALTTGALIGRWLMEPQGFEPVEGKEFTFQTTPAGEWDGVIQCEVLEVVPNVRLVHSWRGGHDANADYGSRLDTVVTWTLATSDGGTRVRLVHSGFRMPKNESAFNNMSQGWPKVVQQIGALAGEQIH